MSHSHFSTWQDDTGAVRITCDTCGEAHTFKSRYFASQWGNRHGIPGMYVRLIGMA